MNKWNNFRFDIGPYPISSLAVKLALLEFGKTVLKHLHGKNTILFMFKVQTDQGFRSITHLQEFQWNKTPRCEVEFEKNVLEEREQIP
jgi:hypothetical protein